MAKSSNPTQILSPPDVILKEEPITLDKPKSPNPLLPADQVEFTFDEITFTPTMREAFIKALTQYVEYLVEFWYTAKTLEDSKVWVSTLIGGGKTGELDQISNKDVTILYCLENGVQVDFDKIIWEDIIYKLNKKTREKVVPYPRFISLLLEYMMPEYDHEGLIINPNQVFSVHNWALKPNQTEGPPFTAHMMAICKLDVPLANKAPNTSSHDEMKDPRDLIRPSSKEAAHSPTGHSKKKKSGTAKDKAPSQPSVSTLVDTELHKEDLQAAGDPTSLRVSSEEGAHPQLSSDICI
ncbi:hypothetical protein Tco_0264646 [Tanacetum coccineum]